jgi:hypothetical protein
MTEWKSVMQNEVDEGGRNCRPDAINRTYSAAMCICNVLPRFFTHSECKIFARIYCLLTRLRERANSRAAGSEGCPWECRVGGGELSPLLGGHANMERVHPASCSVRRDNPENIATNLSGQILIAAISHGAKT